MRYSKQRDTLLRMVRGVSTHPTANEILDMVRQEIPNISLGTIYRNLNQLVEHGLLLQIIKKGIVHYDGHIADHQHFVCTECNKIYDLTLQLHENIQSINYEISHKIDGYELKFWGICSDCQNS